MQIPAKSLKMAAALAAKVAKGGSSPLFSSVRVSAGGTRLHLEATDLDTWLDVLVPCEGPLAATTIEAKFLSTVAKSKGTVAFEEAANGLVVMADGAKRVSVAPMPPDDFPKMDPIPGASVAHGEAVVSDVAALTSALEFVLRAAMNDPVRSYLEVVLVEAGGTAAATDGKSMHVAPTGVTLPIGVVLPKAAVAVLLSAIESTKASRVSVALYGETNGHLSGIGGDSASRQRAAAWMKVALAGSNGAARIIVRAADVDFVPWRMAAPSALRGAVTIDAEAWFKACSAAAKAAEAKHPLSRVEIDGPEARFSVVDRVDERTAFETSAPVSGYSEPDRFVVGVNAAQIARVLKGAKGSIAFGFSWANSPLRFDFPGGRFAISMPYPPEFVDGATVEPKAEDEAEAEGEAAPF